MRYPKTNRIKIAFTKHALKRINERSGHLNFIKDFLEERILSIHKRIDGFEIFIPGGRLVGIFESETFVVKTFVYPWRNKKDYHMNRKISQKSNDYFCIRVLIPTFGSFTNGKSSKKPFQSKIFKINGRGG